MPLEMSASALPASETKSHSCCHDQAEAVPARRPFAETLAYLAQYQPVFVIAGAALLGSIMMIAASGHGMALERGMQVFMGLFLLPLALLKLFDVRGFAAAFRRYDLVAKVWPVYGLIYPFAELALALLFLSGLFPVETNVAALLIGAVGAIGIAQTLARGEIVQCACVGTGLSVPLGSVSIIENAGMAGMAALMLAMM